MVIKSPLSLLFSRLNQPSSLPFLICQASQAFDYPSGPSLDPLQPVHGFVGFFCIAGTKTEHREPRCGLTSAEWDNDDFISAGDALCWWWSPLFISMISLAFFAITAHCSLTSSCLFTRTPRSLSPELLLRQVHPSLCCTPGLCFAKCKILPVSLLNFLRLSVHPINVLLVLNMYFSALPSLVRFSSGFEQTQRFTVKPRRSLSLPLSWP